jgi:beta-N-acetylhexosaminidase
MYSLEDRVGQMFLAGFDGYSLPDHIREWLSEGRIGGVILFARNVEAPAQLAALTAEVHNAAKYPALIGIDQEGGVVARLRQGFSESPGAMALSAARHAEPLTRLVSRMMADEMHALGINWTYAPVLDIAYNRENPTVSVRSFGAEKERVGQLAAAAVEGFQAGGVAACAKHFPGLGDTAIDTHLALAMLNTSVDNLLANDLRPYRKAIEAGLSTVMTTHTVFTVLDPDLPATLSPLVIRRLLREELGFDGVVTSDCMEMKAISDHHSAGETAVLAALAGLDLILISHTRERQAAGYDALLDAARSGRVPESMIAEANRRVAALKDRFRITAPPALEVIRSPAHTALEQEAARAGIVLVQNERRTVPLPVADGAHIGMVEFTTYRSSQAENPDALTHFHRAFKQRVPDLDAVTLSPELDAAEIEQARTIAAESDVVVIATRSAHLNPDQAALARELIEGGARVVLACLRNPYDAEVLPGADSTLLTFGDAAPSLVAVVDALAGAFVPQGQMPVPLDIPLAHTGHQS